MQLLAVLRRHLHSRPLIAYGFTCTEIEIGPTEYNEGDTAIRFLILRTPGHFGGRRLTLTPGFGGDVDSSGNYRIR